ncbi:hypothetical protein LINPERPRIM_LOCUS20976 [Linum perenne]
MVLAPTSSRLQLPAPLTPQLSSSRQTRSEVGGWRRSEEHGVVRGDGMIDVVIRHGGRMDFSGSEPKYVGGEENVFGFDTDYLSYRTLMAVARDDLGYQIVHRMWWLPLKKTMANGLRELFGDNEILYGLMIDVNKVEEGQVVMFFEATKEASGGWDNEDGNLGDDEGDLDRGRKRNIRTVYYSSGGEEIQQCSSSRVFVAATAGNPSHVAEGADERGMSDMNLTPNSSSTQYRQSSDSDHVRPNLSDEGSIHVDEYEPIQEVTRDFTNIRLRQGMKFVEAPPRKSGAGVRLEEVDMNADFMQAPNTQPQSSG